jgi:hypothetical protein
MEAKAVSVAVSHSQSVLATLGDDLFRSSAGPQTGPRRSTTVFIIASPRPATGKTFLARLLAEFLHMNGGLVEAFELSPGDVALSDHLPEYTTPSDLDSTQAQMRLFDRLILADGVAKVVDVGHESFQRFFSLIEEIGFAREARRRGLDVIVLYAADAHPVSTKVFSVLQRRLPNMILAPVFNDGILKGRRLRDQYPVTQAAAVPLQIPILPPTLKAHVERTGHSFADFHQQLTSPIPIGPDFELRSWTKRAFLEFRELELRLLMEKLQDSLKG